MKQLTVVFEGTDFSGKTTLIEEVARILRKDGTYAVERWIEPYTDNRGISGSEWITTATDPIAKGLEYIIRRRFLAADIDKYNERITQKDTINLVDRGILSTLVHNTDTQKQQREIIELHKQLCPNYKPDLIVILNPTMLQLAKHTIKRVQSYSASKNDELDFEKNYVISQKFLKAMELYIENCGFHIPFITVDGKEDNTYGPNAAELVAETIKYILENK